ncbi:CdaR family protein [Clostridium arbusti]|uniref:CdaR family protein n=1 Tax=Clostridium arbusti TaxID=1137848 RepID=UPI00028833DD|nr:CdaR family protein [Clostridium arbusti]
MEKKTKQQIIIKICCVIAAFCLWLYISNWENPIKTYKLKSVSVELINTDALAQSKLTLSPDQNFNVSLTLRGTDLEVMRARPEDFKIVADMSEYAVKKGDNRIPVQIVHYPNNINIENNNAMWVDVNLDDLHQKTVSVKAKIEGSPKEGYYSSEAVISPSDAIVSGPGKFVNMVKNVIINANVANFNKDVDLSVPLQAVDGAGKIVANVKVQPQNVNVTIPIKKAKSVSINIKTTGQVTNGVNIKSLTPVQSTIDVIGDNDSLNKVSSIDTVPIDLSKITENKTINVKLSLPNGISTLSGDNYINVKATVEGIIQKTFSSNINFINVPSGFNASLDNDKENITVSGDESVINSIKDGDIKCNVDCTSLQEGTHNVQVSVALPQGVTNIASDPSTVKVTIVKK